MKEMIAKLLAKETKLNLGCGIVYKPGYINIDNFDNNVSDKSLNIEDLPFESNSINLIEALQVIEHFDFIHCKYLLSEWFRVLKPKGCLILETPDLEKTYKKFVTENLENKKATLQWIYGIDKPGMQHKTGFTFSLLKELLEEIGFENLLKEEQQTHKYEYGIRIKCNKPKNFKKEYIFTEFRKRLIKGLDIDDSYFLIPLENYIKKMNDFSRELNNKSIDIIISKTAYCNPKIPLLFLDECINQKLIERNKFNNEARLLKFLFENDFHKKVFTLWSKRKKTQDIEHEIKSFLTSIESLLLEILENCDNFKERLSYILKLEPYPIKIFDFTLVFQEAEKFYNKGLKEMQNNKTKRASEYFLKSLKLNPMLKPKILELERFKSIRLI